MWFSHGIWKVCLPTIHKFVSFGPTPKIRNYCFISGVRSVFQNVFVEIDSLITNKWINWQVYHTCGYVILSGHLFCCVFYICLTYSTFLLRFLMLLSSLLHVLISLSLFANSLPQAKAFVCFCVFEFTFLHVLISLIRLSLFANSGSLAGRFVCFCACVCFPRAFG